MGAIILSKRTSGIRAVATAAGVASGTAAQVAAAIACVGQITGQSLAIGINRIDLTTPTTAPGALVYSETLAAYSSSALAPGAAGTPRTYLFTGDATRASAKTYLRQTGTMVGIRFALSDAGGTMETLRVVVTSRSGNTLGTLKWSANLASLVNMASNDWQTVLFPTPITGVGEGDTWGVEISGVGFNFLDVLTGTNQNLWNMHYRADNAVSLADGAMLGSDTTAQAWACPIQPLMAQPNLVGYGDSLLTGHGLGTTSNYTPWEADATYYTTNDKVTMGYLLAQALGWTYQNNSSGGVGAQYPIAQFAARVAAMHPKACLVHIGINDIAAKTGSDPTYTLDEWIALLFGTGGVVALCEAADVVPMFVEMLPLGASRNVSAWPTGRTTLPLVAATINTWNARLRSECDARGIVCCACHDAMGEALAGAGAHDALIAAYTKDGLHLNTAGHAAWLAAILTNF